MKEEARLKVGRSDRFEIEGEKERAGREIGNARRERRDSLKRVKADREKLK